ncbi:toll-like receptor 6 [Lytechinus variegatus]|uniref:toll-like receptor 6 n=1 Tax=Lytechinus variegatus TaxID=7654 RepID=UPI001BB17FB4|nr:toll-like receptor 6 [Lytechinus variegatus]
MFSLHLALGSMYFNIKTNMYFLLYLVFLCWRTSCCFRCLDICDCVRRGYAVNIECTERNLDVVPENLRCDVGKLDLRRNFITSLHKESFPCQREMVLLLLSHNQLSYIEENTFDDTPKLAFIVLDSNFLQNVPYLGSLPLIIEISVSRNHITKLHHPILRNTSQTDLSLIQLAFNKLEKLPKIHFRVSALNLKGNAITDISTKMLAYPRAISDLDISHNEVDYMDNLQPMENLKTLALEFNFIRSISDTAFSHLPSLETINLERNYIVDALPFKNMKDIKHIFLNNNHLRFIGAPAFTNIPNIISIDLTGNNIINFKYEASFLTSVTLILCNNNLLKMNISNGRNNSKVEYLNVKHNKLETLPLLHFPLLNSLWAEDNMITNVQFGVNGHQNIKYIHLTNNQIRNLTSFRTLSNLKEIVLVKNFITTWDDTYLIGSSQLLSLILSNNKLSELSTFTPLAHLQELNLSGNMLHTIHKSTFNSTPQLSVLNLSQNEICSLAFLGSMSFLVELDISHNRLSVINPNDFSSIVNLQHLDLSFNFITEINIITPIMHTLQNLDISHNQLTDFNLNNLLNQETFLYLNIEGNHITRVISVAKHVYININSNAIGFFNSSSISGRNILACSNNLKNFKQVMISSELQGLFLSLNQIASIPNFTFISASSLLFLHLDDNHIAHISSLAFFGLQRVHRINLERNNLVSLPPGVFSYIPRLRYLRLGDNPLTYISNRPFSQINGLYGAYLGRFPFSNITTEVLQDLQLVEFLDVSENSAFRAFFINNQENLSIPEFPNLLILNLSSNDLGSHCAVMSMKQVEIIDLSNNSLISIPKDCLPQYSKAYTLYLSGNKIMNISRDAFHKHHRFWNLDLADNRIVFFEWGSLQYQTYLLEINLAGNRLSKLDLGFLTFSVKMIMMNLHDVPWSCDCDLIRAARKLNQYNKIICEDPLLHVKSTLTEEALADNLRCRLQLCSGPDQTLLSFVGDTMVELPCPVITPNFIYWSVTFNRQQPISIGNTTPHHAHGVSVLPHGALLIKYVTKNITGIYTCWSENEFGRTKFTINMLVQEEAWNTNKLSNKGACSNFTSMSVRRWKKTLQCGYKSSATTIKSSYDLLLSLILAIHSLIL